MRFNLKKTIAGAAAVAVIASVAPFIGSGVASAATNNNTLGALAIAPATGTSTTNITLTAQTNTVGARSVGTANLTAASNTVTAAGGAFTAADLFRPVSFTGAAGTAVPTAGNVITAVTNATTVVLSGQAASGAGTATATMNLLARTSSCPGDTAGGNFRYSAFLVPAATDLDASLQFDAFGVTNVAGYTTALLDTSGNSVLNRPTNIAGGPGQPGLFGVPQVNFSLFAPGEVPAGSYKIGVACHIGSPSVTQLQTHWSRLITVTATTVALGGPAAFTFALGAAAVAPTLTAATPGNGQITAVFSPGASDPAVPAGGFTATATPGVGPAITATGSASPIVIPGLTNGTAYTVTVSANNGVGAPAVSNAISATPVLPAAPAVTGLGVVSGPGQATVSWAPYTAPVGTTLSGFSVAVTSGILPGTPVVGSPFTVGAAVTNFTQAGPQGVPLNFTVTPLFSAPIGQTGLSAGPVTGTPIGSAVINQVITVTRPNGALVLTQVCGRYGSLPAEPAQLAFPSGLAALGPVNDGDNVNPVLGNAPYLTQSGVPFSAVGTTSGPGSTPVAAGPQDPKFASYPYPDNPITGEADPTYPTWCGIELGAARFVATGAPAFGQGQFYSASGRLNQVTVVDTRDTDPGWNIAASVTNFTAAGGKSFSGNQMGWTPVRNRNTAPFTDALGNVYSQSTSAGAGVAQNTLVSSGNGLFAGAADTLITAPARSGAANNFVGGLGIGVADARIKLAIPVTALSGNYTAVLTISAL